MSDSDPSSVAPPEVPHLDQMPTIMGFICDPDCRALWVKLVNFVILGYLTWPNSWPLILDSHSALTDDCLPQLNLKRSQLFSRETSRSVSHTASHPLPPNQTESQTWRNKLQSQAWKGRWLMPTQCFPVLGQSVIDLILEGRGKVSVCGPRFEVLRWEE